MKRLQSMDAEEAYTDEKTVINSEKIVLLAPKLAVTAEIQNFEFKILNFKLLFALLTSNITYIKRLRSMGAEEASTDEKTAKIQTGMRTKNFFFAQNVPQCTKTAQK